MTKPATEPTNLYRQDLFPSLDYTISFHAGVMARMMSQRGAGVPAAERRLLAAAWRRWEQAAEALDHSDEAEEFQAVAMRCRECLIALAKAFGSTAVMPPGTEAPRGADFLGVKVSIYSFGQVVLKAYRGAFHMS